MMSKVTLSRCHNCNEYFKTGPAKKQACDECAKLGHDNQTAARCAKCLNEVMAVTWDANNAGTEEGC